MLEEVYAPQRKPRIEAFILVPASIPTGTAAQTATGCTEGTYRCTVLKNGTGDYTVNFNAPFARTPVVTANALHTSQKNFIQLYSVSTTAVRLLSYTDTGSAQDPTNVMVNVIGFDAADQV